MNETDTAHGGSYESRKDIPKTQAAQVQRWLRAIDLASAEEKKWREEAEEARDVFRSKNKASKQRFNILYSNIETVTTALYNSTPVPDVRRRYSDADDEGKTVSQIIERALTYSIDEYDFDGVILDAIHDRSLAGRGLSRVRYHVGSPEQGTPEKAVCEHVDWKHFRRGPATRWEKLPWIAFELFMTREQLIALDKERGKEVNLDVTLSKEPNKQQPDVSPNIFKRARVWEIWDRQTRKVIFIAPSYKKAPVTVIDDPMGLRGFFPVPKALYATRTTDSLVPLVPYRIYKPLADELEEVTRRIQSITRVLKWRGVYDSSVDAFRLMAQADDGELLPSESNVALMEKGGLENAIWLMPIDKAIGVLKQLYEQREQIKETIFEVTGISDIVRGASDPNETLGAQEIKTQFGTMRLQSAQAEVQRYARDLFRLKAEIICNNFSPENIQAMTGIQIEEGVRKLLQSGVDRSYRIDIESDSTIRGDVRNVQTNMGQFLEGTAKFIQSIGPAVEAGMMPADVALDIYAPFARAFNLGKQAEDALERMSEQARQAAQQPEAQQPSPEQVAAEAKRSELEMGLEAKRAEEAMKLEGKQAENRIDLEAKLLDAQLTAEAMEHKAQVDIAAKKADAKIRDEARG